MTQGTRQFCWVEEMVGGSKDRGLLCLSVHICRVAVTMPVSPQLVLSLSAQACRSSQSSSGTERRSVNVRHYRCHYMCFYRNGDNYLAEMRAAVGRK